MNNTTNKSDYRPEIDGLRALAVISVILYHAKFTFLGNNWFEGGYVGVDIFFVISGYLIGRIIISELHQTEHFNYLEFLERRARRILPMLFMVILISIPFAWMILLPSKFIEYSESIISSVFFISNIFFYLSTTEYGSTDALLMPFLHTWSLSVEEQFYLFSPLLLLIIYKYLKNYLFHILISLTLLSLLTAHFMAHQYPSLNFFFPISRFWELAIGATLSIHELQHEVKKCNIKSQLLQITGLIFIFYSIFTFNHETLHPSLNTIIPVIGAILILRNYQAQSIVRKMLAWRPTVYIGLVSYSAYLWHFPIFSLARNITPSLSNTEKIICILLTFCLSFISYFWIEKPFRSFIKIPTRIFLFVTLIAFIIIIIAVGLINLNNGYTNRFKPSSNFTNYQFDNKYLDQIKGEFYKNKNKNEFSKLAPNKILIIGNSHGVDTYISLVQHIDKFKNTEFLYSIFPGQISCFDEGVEEFRKHQVKFYASNPYLEANRIIVSTKFAGERPCIGISKSETHTSDFIGLRHLIRNSIKDDKDVVVLGDFQGFSSIENKIIPDYIYDTYKNSDIPFITTRKTAGELMFLNLINNNFSAQAKKIADEEGAIYFDKQSTLCDFKNKICDAFTREGFKTFHDNSHFTIEGAYIFGARLVGDDDFRKVIAP